MNVGKYLRGAVLLLAAGVFVMTAAPAVLAQTETDGDPNELLMTTQSAEVKTTLEERLMRRKEALTTQLTNAQATRLQARCAAAQTKLTTMSTRLEAAANARQTAYSNIQDRLAGLVEKLQAADIDTAELEASLAELGEKVAAYQTAITDYQQTIADLLEMTCADDASGFRASLDAAKTEQAAVKTAAQDVRTHLQETLKPLLQEIRTQLQEAN